MADFGDLELVDNEDGDFQVFFEITLKFPRQATRVYLVLGDSPSQALYRLARVRSAVESAQSVSIVLKGYNGIFQ